MGRIIQLREYHLVGGETDEKIYPITATKAVYDETNTSLDDILKKIVDDVNTNFRTLGDSLGTALSNIISIQNDISDMKLSIGRLYNVATPVSDGLMSAADKIKLDSLIVGGNVDYNKFITKEEFNKWFYRYELGNGDWAIGTKLDFFSEKGISAYGYGSSGEGGGSEGGGSGVSSFAKLTEVLSAGTPSSFPKYWGVYKDNDDNLNYGWLDANNQELSATNVTFNNTGLTNFENITNVLSALEKTNELFNGLDEKYILTSHPANNITQEHIHILLHLFIEKTSDGRSILLLSEDGTIDEEASHINERLYTDLDFYSLKGVSAYGYGASGESGGGGVYKFGDLEDVLETEYSELQKTVIWAWKGESGGGFGWIDLPEIPKPEEWKPAVDYMNLWGHEKVRLGDTVKNTLTLTNDKGNSVVITVDENGHLKIDGDMYATGGVSAYGYGESSVPTGATSFSELSDSKNAITGNLPIGSTSIWANYMGNYGWVDASKFGREYTSSDKYINIQKGEYTIGLNIDAITSDLDNKYISKDKNYMDLWGNTVHLGESTNNDITLQNGEHEVKIGVDDDGNLKIYKSTGVANLYATGGISAYGYGASSEPTGSNVSWNQIYTNTNGEHIATITIDGDITRIYAPKGGASSWNEISGKPNTLAGYEIQDAYTQYLINDIFAKKTDVVTSLAAATDNNKSLSWWKGSTKQSDITIPFATNSLYLKRNSVLTDLNSPEWEPKGYGLSIQNFENKASNTPTTGDNANALLNIGGNEYGLSGMHYGWQIAFQNGDNNMYFRNWRVGIDENKQRYQYRSEWKKFAFTDSEVSKATKLTSDITLWGVSGINGGSNITTAPNLYVGVNKVTNTAGTQISLGGDRPWYLRSGGSKETAWCSLESDTNSKSFYIINAVKKYNSVQFFVDETVANDYVRVFGKMYVDGNVGIGTITPNAKLHVVGSVYATGNVTFDSNAYIKNTLFLGTKGIYFENTSDGGTIVAIHDSNTWKATGYKVRVDGDVNFYNKIGVGYNGNDTLSHALCVNGAIRIGQALLSYDTSNKALKISDTNGGGQVHLYATGGIAAYSNLGDGMGNLTNLSLLDTLTVPTIKSTDITNSNSITTKTELVTNTLSIGISSAKANITHTTIDASGANSQLNGLLINDFICLGGTFTQDELNNRYRLNVTTAYFKTGIKVGVNGTYIENISTDSTIVSNGSTKQLTIKIGNYTYNITMTRVL